MWFSRLLRSRGWRFAAVPLAVWLTLTVVGASGLVWLERSDRVTLVQRFQLRVQLVADFVTSYVADLIDRERVQAEAFLTDPVVDENDFARSVDGFGYPAAVLLDEQGRALHVSPKDPSVLGRRLSDRYPHLRTATVDGRPAVSPVVPSAVRGVPVVAFAVPFHSAAGRRVFSGAVDIRDSPLASYLGSAIAMSRVRVHLADTSGAVVAANHGHGTATPNLRVEDARLAAALEGSDHGRYRDGDDEPWYFASHLIPGTPWRLSASVPESVLYAPVAGHQIGGRAALAAAAAVGLLVVTAVGRARRNRRELQLSEQRFRSVFDNSRVGMTLADRGGVVMAANPAVCRMLGRAEPDLVGRRCIDLVHPDDVGVGTDELRECLAGRAAGLTVDVRYLHADGHVVETTVTAAVLHDERGRPEHLATQIVDITARRALERDRERDAAALARHAAQLQQANTQMSDFIAMLTHDVRQPLSSIVGGGEVLLDDWDGTDDATKLRYVRRMTASGHRADHIVTEILTLAQLDAGALTTRPVRLDAQHAVREAVRAFTTALDVPVVVTAPDEAPAFADPVQLQLMLGNLLSNALKYGSPPIELTVTRGREHVQIRVSDHGEGVPDDFVPHLFERFSRAGSGVATTKPGTGLGLHFVRQLARASGIDIAYQPHQPRGATFVLTLPTTRPVTPEPQHRAVAAAH